MEGAWKARDEERWADAANVCQQVLDRDSMKTKFSSRTEALGIIYDLFGDSLHMCGYSEEARLHLEKAVHIRDPVEYGGLGKSSRENAAYCRERLANVLEFEGQMEDARRQRLKGKAQGEVLCSAVNCPSPGFHSSSELRACTGCRAVFYHSIECQKKDWNERHKDNCKAYQARMEGKAAEA